MTLPTHVMPRKIRHVDTKEPMKAFHAFFSCHALNLRDLRKEHLWFLHHFQCEISTEDFAHGADLVVPACPV